MIENTPAGSGATPGYERLRWAIRITGIVLMFGGAIYLGLAAAALLTEKRRYADPIDGLYALIVPLVTLGLVIFAIRTGLRMLRTLDTTTISHFSFLFALIYTPILMQLLPAAGVFSEHPEMIYLLLLLYFGLSYWILRRILLFLLLPKGTA